MYANRLILIASVLTLAACSDNNQPGPTGPARTDAVMETSTIEQQLHGTLILDEPFNALWLQTELGPMSVRGPVTNTMASVAGADVLVTGIVDDAGRMTVNTFQVVGYAGHPAIDGYLEIDREGVQSLRLADGTAVVVDDAPKTLREYVGRRIWLIQRDGDELASFGLIQ